MANVPGLPEPNFAAGGMSYLQLVQRLRQEAGVSGSDPATTIGQTGEIKRLCNWISSAWMDIQTMRPDWFFMQQAVQFNTTPGKQVYTAADAGILSFGNFKTDTFRQYRQSAGVASEFPVAYLNWQKFRDVHLYSTMRQLSQMPYNFTVDPQKNFQLGPIPDDIYVINGEGYAMPTEFSQDSDRPTMPSQFHMIIVWRALIHYAKFEAAQESLTHGKDEYDRMLRMLLRDQSPEITISEAFA